MSARPNAARTASRIATIASSPDAGESSRTCSSMPSATMTRCHANGRWSSVCATAASAAYAECRRERLGNAALEQVAGGLPHLALDDLERLTFPLTDLDREQLEEMAVVVGSGCARSFRPVEQTVRHVKANGPARSAPLERMRWWAAARRRRPAPLRERRDHARSRVRGVSAREAVRRVIQPCGEHSHVSVALRVGSQGHRHGRPGLARALDGDGPTVLIDDPLGECQADAGASRLRGHERLEDARQHLGRNRVRHRS